MAFNPSTGKWEYENPAVSNQLTGLLSKNTDYMKAATTSGLKTANKRGLLNSSIAVGAAHDSAIKNALPVASQDAAQISQQNLQRGQFDHDAGQLDKQLGTQKELAYANIASYDREKAAALGASFENSYAEIYRTIAQNENLPAKVRDSYLAHAATIRDSNYNFMSQLYGIEIDWGDAGGEAAP